MKAVLGVDLGTSSAKALLLGEDGSVLARGKANVPTLTPRPGQIEQNPNGWWRAVVDAVRACLEACTNPADVSGLGFSGHMSVLLPLDHTMRPLRPAITIADARGEAEAQWLNEEYRGDLATATGNVALSAFTLPKLLWYRANEPRLFAQTHAVVGAKDYLRLRATGTLGTEPTDAGNTLLLEYAGRRWNYDLIERLELPQTLFPTLNESLDVVGHLSTEAAAQLGLPPDTPVIAGLADMAASVLGCGIVEEGRTAITLGTSGQITQAVAEPSPELLGRFTYHPHALPDKTYVMASLFTGGLGLQWFAELLSSVTGETTDVSIEQVLESAQKSEPGARGVLFLPYLTGSGSPDFDPQKTASFTGLSRYHSGGDMSRAVLEGVAFSVRQCLEQLAKHHKAPDKIVVGGGGMANTLWRAILSDVTGLPLFPLHEGDAGALGTALAAGAAVKLFPELGSQLERSVTLNEPASPEQSRRTLYDQAYQRYLEGSGAG